MQKHLVHKCVAAVIAFFVFGPLLIMAADYGPPIVIIETKIIPKTTRAGESINVEWTATERRACNGTIYRRFIDSSGTIFDMAPVTAIYRDGGLIGGVRRFSRSILTPTGMAPGRAIFTASRVYRCHWNLLHLIWPIVLQTDGTEFFIH